MEDISQKDINAICHSLRTFSNGKLADKLEKADVISALYVLNYLKAVDTIRKNTQVFDTSSDFNKKYKMKRNDYEGFKKSLDRNYQLELNYLIDTPEKFEGMYWLLNQALDRQHLICDFDDGIHPPTKIGQCQNEYHSEHFDTNPKNQKLHLTYGYSEDNHKMDKRESYYICDGCQKEINECGEGYISCDMEMAE